MCVYDMFVFVLYSKVLDQSGYGSFTRLGTAYDCIANRRPFPFIQGLGLMVGL